MKFTLFGLFFILSLFAKENHVIRLKDFKPINFDSGIFFIRLENLYSQQPFLSQFCIKEELEVLGNSNVQTISNFSNILNNCKIQVRYANIDLELIPESLFQDTKSLEFNLKTQKLLPLEKEALLEVKVSDKLILKSLVKLSKPKEILPVIAGIFPSSGASGDVISIFAKNVDENPENTLISLEYFTNDNFSLSHELAWTRPVFVSPVNSEGIQVVKFVLPFNIKLHIDSFQFLKKVIQIKMIVNQREAYYENPESLNFYLLHPRWKLILMGFSFLSILIIYLIIGIFRNKIFWTRGVFLDKKFNKYSLAKFELLSWSAVFLFGLFYIIYYFFLFERSYSLSWNYSLLFLILVVYIPLFISRKLDQFYPKNELILIPPKLSDLVFSKNSLDIIRFQMFSCSVLSQVLFLYLIFSKNLFESRLEIPYHLIGFLLLSRIIYLLGKLTREKVVVYDINPRTWTVLNSNILLELKGYGFKKGQKIQIGNSNLYPLIVENQTSAKVFFKEKLNEGIHKIFIYSSSQILADTIPCICITQKSPVEPNPPELLCVESNSSTHSNSA